LLVLLNTGSVERFPFFHLFEASNEKIKQTGSLKRIKGGVGNENGRVVIGHDSELKGRRFTQLPSCGWTVQSKTNRELDK
jgi:hypothetical protein